MKDPVYWRGDTTTVPPDRFGSTHSSSELFADRELFATSPSIVLELDAPSSASRTAIGVLTAVSFWFAIWLLVFNVKFRAHPLIRMSSPMINKFASLLLVSRCSRAAQLAVVGAAW